MSAGRTTSLEFFLRQTSGAEAAEAGTGRGIEPWNPRILSWPTYEEKLRPRGRVGVGRLYGQPGDEQGWEAALPLSRIPSS